jgi:hypothetical protein
MDDDDNVFSQEVFRRIGQSLDMPGEIDKEQLKRVPKKSWTGDMRRPFFTKNANSNKYYYMPVGDIPQNPHRNTLVPLGKFLGFDDYRPAPGGYGKIPITDSTVGTEYYMRFSIPPYNNSEHGAIGMEANPLVYTEEPPASNSVPLTYNDYLEQLSKGGKKTKKRKNRKSKKTRKYKKRKGKNK